MVINEKALINRMKEAYKTYGYCVAVTGGRTYLSNGFWIAGIDSADMPGEILGMFGQHIRDIPKNGDAYKVTKTKDGPMVQKRILEDAMDQIQSMIDQRNETFADIRPTKMLRTVLTYDGLQVWQAENSREIFLMDPRYAAMIANPKDAYQVGNGIYAEGAGSQLWALRFHRSEEKKYIEHLESLEWLKA